MLEVKSAAREETPSLWKELSVKNPQHKLDTTCFEPHNTPNYWATSSHRHDQDPKMEILRTFCTNKRQPNTKSHPPMATNRNASNGKTKEQTMPNIPERPSQSEYVHTTPLDRCYSSSPFEGRLESPRRCPGYL